MRSQGVVDERFAAVREVFDRLLASGAETGAGLVVRHDGREVVRLSGGWTDAAHSAPWRDDTLVQVFSLGKPLAALTAVKVLADAGVGLDRPVAEVWPDYAAAGKSATTLRQLLSHQAGQPAFPETTSDLLDDARLRAELAAAAPEWRPGSRIAEHALTYGHLLDGVVRAITGRSLGEVFRHEVAAPLEWDAHFGVLEADLPRVAELVVGDPAYWTFGQAGGLVQRALTTPPGALEVAVANSGRWRQAQFPAIGLHATAAAVASFFAALTDTAGPVARLLGEQLHGEFIAPQASGHDEFLNHDVTWTLGAQRGEDELAMGGIGGSTAWVSLRHGYSCAYLTRHLAGPHRMLALEEVLDSLW
ncbi:serine hydrolase domain-containing protein [Saccharopolyspora kobensis]|uniref:serine hydrolase domain-containing protein n=1 Tax=Saccharopolyspora kobensis TaxID=146035 RepID=UPI000B85B322|nr:serine hydrolase domain-containing protein [Saccharopolyspora kobensis]